MALSPNFMQKLEELQVQLQKIMSATAETKNDSILCYDPTAIILWHGLFGASAFGLGTVSYLPFLHAAVIQNHYSTSPPYIEEVEVIPQALLHPLRSLVTLEVIHERQDQDIFRKIDQRDLWTQVESMLELMDMSADVESYWADGRKLFYGLKERKPVKHRIVSFGSLPKDFRDLRSLAFTSSCDIC